MNIPTKKLKSGFEIPVLGLGTWDFGGKKERIENYDESRDIIGVQKAIEMGFTHFDTAEMYAQGYSEEILGKAIKKQDRSKLFITSKVSPANLRYDDVIKSCKASLKRLQLNYLDMYLIHVPNHDIAIEETMRAFDELKKQGLIKSIGVSNFSIESFEEAQSKTNNKIVVNQIHYSLLFRIPEATGLLKYCQENDVLLEAWRPLHYGQLGATGTRIMDELAEKYNKKPAQIALNWLTSQDNVFTIVKASSINHLEENLGAVNWEMEKDDIEYLRDKFPYQSKRSCAVQPS
ncbi:aldo/keto reductase [Candidatus Parcubacteria bacterium]|nr:aldo/keto reductase [Candidatus Parcubacteria bacterium]